MNTLRQAVQEYLTMRRSLGFKLRDAGKLLLAFVKCMEQCRAAPPTSQPSWRSPGRSNRRPCNRRNGRAA